jgi:hypothetical protein
MMTTTSKTALVDQLLAALRTTPRPLTAAELALLLPKDRVGDTDCYHRPDDPNGHPEAAWARRTIVCHGDYDVVWRDRMSQDVYPDLVNLEKQGLCSRVPLPARGKERRWAWVWAGESADAEVAELEAMLDVVR